MKPKDVLALAKDRGAVMVDLKFMDFVGLWQHFTIPLPEMKEEIFDEGLGFDGSSIRGWAEIHASDMLVFPDPSSAVMDPFTKDPTLSLVCNIVDPITKEPYGRDPRNIAMKAEKYLKSTGLADTAYFGPEAEFFIFDEVRFDSKPNASFYEIGSSEAAWSTGKEEGNRGYKVRYKEGYFPVAPLDSLNDIRTEMCRVLADVGIEVERQHHEVATAGQAEIDFRFNTLVKCADNLSWFKYIVKNVAWRHGKTATFMPKPVFGDNGSGMHTHQSLWKNGKPLFAGDGYAGMSEMALHYIGGILKHARALAAICNPTTNSYKRLVPGFEAPVNLAYSSRNRSASIRIPMVQPQPEGEAAGVPQPGSVVQPVPGLLRAADGRSGRDREQDRPRRSAGQGHLRAVAGGAEGRPEDAGEPRGGAGLPPQGPQVPPQGRRLHRGRDRHLDQPQAGQGSEPGAAPPASDGVRALLRHLTELDRGRPGADAAGGPLTGEDVRWQRRSGS